VPFLILLGMYWTTPHFEDNFYIHAEMKYLFICLCAQYACYYGFLALMSMMPQLHNTDTEHLLYFIVFQLVVGVQFAAMLISTVWVNRRCEHIIKWHRYEIHTVPNRLHLAQKHCIEIQPEREEIVDLPAAQTELAELGTLSMHGAGVHKLSGESLEHFEDAEAADAQSFMSDVGDDDSTHHKSVANTFRERLYDILATEVTYNEFIRHLSKEFSIELLLSLTEFVQFHNAQKALCAKQTDDKDTKDAKREKRESKSVSGASEPVLVLPASIPQSYIVENSEWSGPEQAFLLFTKYIKSGAEFEINISSEQRGYYERLMGDYKVWMANTEMAKPAQLSRLFDSCCAQMVYLMIDSKKRFEDTPVYSKLHRKLSSKHSRI